MTDKITSFGELLQSSGDDSILRSAESISKVLNIQWNNPVKYALKSILKYPELAPAIRGKDNSLRAQLKKWLTQYNNGYVGRSSVRKSNVPGTIPDPMVEIVIRNRLKLLNNTQVNDINWGHRVGMQAENIIGALLEEYLAINLEKYRWYCAWGASIKAVDFVSSNQKLLQVKNRDNSENSSSRKVRDGTKIISWYRSKSTKLEYKWEEINEICGTDNELTEDGFKNFVETCIANNPDCVAIEADNPWLEYS